MVAAVDKGDGDTASGEPLHNLQPTEACPHDHHTMAT